MDKNQDQNKRVSIKTAISIIVIAILITAFFVYTDIVNLHFQSPFFLTLFYKGDSPTSIFSHFPVGVCADNWVNLRHSFS